MDTEQMSEKRIYGKRTDIDTEHVREFYDRRAAQASSGDIGAVLLGVQDKTLLDRRNRYDQEYILPLLNIGAETRVLDLGCGLGRWAGFLLPKCGFYCGVDFSREMTRLAEQTCRQAGGAYQVYCMSAVEAAAKSPEFYGGKFGTLIAGGVLAYINDTDAADMLHNLPNLLEEKCTVYLADQVGIQERLTLRDYPSAALAEEYSSIYRTPEEYLELCRPLLKVGFTVLRDEFRPESGENYSDTRRHHIILRRG